MTSAHIRPVVSADFDQWRRLYQGYADFYQVALSDDGVKTTWSWLIEPAHVCTGLVAEQPDGLVGLAHFRGMPSPLRDNNYRARGLYDKLAQKTDWTLYEMTAT